MLDFSKTDFFFDNKKYVNGVEFNAAKKDILDYAQFGFHLSSAGSDRLIVRSFDWFTAKYRVKTVARILSIQIIILFPVYPLVSSKKVGHKKQVNPNLVMRISTRKTQNSLSIGGDFFLEKWEINSFASGLGVSNIKTGSSVSVLEKDF